jgi:type 1 glutamine amidotransferase
MRTIPKALPSTFAILAIFLLPLSTQAAEIKPPLKALFVTGGGYHDYKKLAPFLTSNLAQLVNVTFDVKFGLEALRDPKFADSYDAIVYDMCDDEVADEVLENALQATHKGKPAVMIHCAVHAFRRSSKIREWETCCGMRSKVHDPFGPFTVTKLDEKSPITKFFPDNWKTPGDELYQTISIDPQSHQLLRAKSPKDGREHIVCWTYQYGQGQVFATTLGHDLKTASSPEYLRLLANGLLWAAGKLKPNGQPVQGYGAPKTVP